MTSPHYPLTADWYDCSTFKDYETWLEQMRAWITASYKVLRKGGRLAIQADSTRAATNGGSKVPGTKYHNVYADLSNIAKEAGFGFFDEKCWFKQACIGRFAPVGSVGSPSSPTSQRNHEYILIFAKESIHLEGDPKDIDITLDEFNTFNLSQWYLRPADRGDVESPDWHPCPFPQEIPYRLIRLLTYKGDVVLDCFNGSGTTCFVAAALGRRFIGIDLSPLCCESARKRLATLDGMTEAEKYARIVRFQRDVLPNGELESETGWSKTGPEIAREIAVQTTQQAGTVSKANDCHVR